AMQHEMRVEVIDRLEYAAQPRHIRFVLRVGMGVGEIREANLTVARWRRRRRSGMGCSAAEETCSGYRGEGGATREGGTRGEGGHELSFTRRERSGRDAAHRRALPAAPQGAG